MIELFKDISDEIRGIAKTGWIIAMHKSSPAEAAQFISNLIDYHRTLMRPKEEIEFLEFYFKTKMLEMMKDDYTDSER